MDTLTKIIFQQRDSYGILNFPVSMQNAFQKFFPFHKLKQLLLQLEHPKPQALITYLHICFHLFCHIHQKQVRVAFNYCCRVWNPSRKTTKSDKIYQIPSLILYLLTFLQLSSDLKHVTKIQKAKQWLLCHSQCTSDWGLSPLPCPRGLLADSFLYKLEYNWTHLSAVKWKAIKKMKLVLSYE